MVKTPVTSLGMEPYFGIPTPTSLSIRVAHFVHNITESCDQLSPLGLTANVPNMDFDKEFAVLIGNGAESRIVKYSELNQDLETIETNEL